MNSTVGLIFNEKVAEKCNLWVHKQCTNAPFTIEKSTNAGLKKKEKEKENADFSKTWTCDVESKRHLSVTMFSSINNFQVLIKMQHLNLASQKLYKKKKSAS